MSSTTVLIRLARAGDAAAIAELVARCSGQTRQRRFHGGTAAIPRAYLARVCAPQLGDRHLVAVASPAQIVGLASLADGELGLLVDDAWQGAGIGRELLRLLLLRADGVVTADVGAGNEPVLAWLRRLRPLRIVPQEHGWRIVLAPAASLAALAAPVQEAA